MYGNRILKSGAFPTRTSVIGELETTAAGNIVVPVGHLVYYDSNTGWQKTEHVVLNKTEARLLAINLLNRIGP